MLLGIYSIVGYYGTRGGIHTNLPNLKKGILSPLDGLNREITNKKLIEKVNMLYAKDYKIINDLSIPQPNSKAKRPKHGADFAFPQRV